MVDAVCRFESGLVAGFECGQHCILGRLRDIHLVILGRFQRPIERYRGLDVLSHYTLSVYRARLEGGPQVPVVAYHFCLALPAAITQPGDHLLAEPCNETT